MPSNAFQGQLSIPPSLLAFLFFLSLLFFSIFHSFSPHPTCNSLESPNIFQADLELLGSIEPPASDYQGAGTAGDTPVFDLTPNLIQGLVQLEATILNRLVIAFISPCLLPVFCRSHRFCFVEIGFHYRAQAGLELKTLSLSLRDAGITDMCYLHLAAIYLFDNFLSTHSWHLDHVSKFLGEPEHSRSVRYGGLGCQPPKLTRRLCGRSFKIYN